MRGIFVVFLLCSCTVRPDRTVANAVGDYARWSGLTGNLRIAFEEDLAENAPAVAVCSKPDPILALDLPWLSAASRAEVYAVVGHELGHVSTCGEVIEHKEPSFELLADCISGGFVEEYLSIPDADHAVRYIASFGDMHPELPGHHGTPRERARAMEQGRFLSRSGVDVIPTCKEVMK